jgi:hypothetical protein
MVVVCMYLEDRLDKSGGITISVICPLKFLVLE